MAETRKLAAILAADVAGYSRLAGADEERTLARLRALRSDLIDPTIAVHHGRVVKRTGDGVLIEFRSVVDAVRCAIEIQNGMMERNAGLPSERRIEFRVGIHLGDVVEESDGDLMGDGVNIAARLEGIAKPGAICLSEDAYRQVKSRLNLAVSDLGTTQLKNIAEPVRVYSVEVGKPASPKPKAVQRNLVPIIAAIVSLIVIAGVAGFYFERGPKSVTSGAPQPTAASPPAELAKQSTPEPPKVTPERISIVVLPFTNLGGDPAQDYLADVITDELTTSLSRIVGSFVIARSTAFTYKSKAIDAKQIGKELGVRYLLEGSAQPSGNRVRIVAQLISAETGAHLWAQQFDANRDDLMQMQDEIVTSLTRALEAQLSQIVAMEAVHIARTRPGNASAQDLALQCFASSWTDLKFDVSLCERALQIDPRNALALGLMAWNFLSPVMAAKPPDTHTQEAIQRADEWVTKAIAADPNRYPLYALKAWVLILQKRPEEAIIAAERSLALNPSHVYVYSPLAAATAALGHPERAVEIADKAIRLSPRDPDLLQFYFVKTYSYFMMQQDVQVIEWARRALTAQKQEVWPIPRLYLAAALALNGSETEAREIIKHYLSLPGVEIRSIRDWTAWLYLWSDTPSYSAFVKRLSEGLRRAGMPEE